MPIEIGGSRISAGDIVQIRASEGQIAVKRDRHPEVGRVVAATLSACRSGCAGASPGAEVGRLEDGFPLPLCAVEPEDWTASS
jgi:hypothetical protein